MKTTYNAVQKEVETKFVLGETKSRDGNKQGLLILSITTAKGYNGGVRTSAMVNFHSEGFTQHAFSFSGDKNGDFGKTVIQTPAKRVTENLLKACHAEAQVCFNTVLSEALAHYDITQEQYLSFHETNLGALA